MRKTLFTIMTMISLLAATTANAQSEMATINTDVAFGCRSPRVFDKIAEIASSGDRLAAERAVTAGILIGDCAVLPKGARVYIEETEFFSGRIKVREQGAAVGFWVLTKSIDIH